MSKLTHRSPDARAHLQKTTHTRLTMPPSSSVNRVLFLSHDAGLFGAQRMLLTLLQGLDRSQFEPHVVAPEPGPFVDALPPLNIPVNFRYLVRWVPSSLDMKGRSRWLQLARLMTGLRNRVWAVARLIERHQIDLVFTNTVTIVEGALAAHITKKPHLWHIHEPVFRNSELVPLLPAFAYTKGINTLSKAVIFPSASVAQNYRGLESKTHIIYNGLRLPASMDRAAARATLSHNYGLDPQKKWIAVVGALQPRKDHSTFVEAARLVLAANRDALFLIVGTGPESEKARLEALLHGLGGEPQVKLLGPWLGDINVVMHAIDLLVISSEQESFGLTAIEAFAAATPVLSTRCGGPQEIIEDGVNGRLVPVRDPAAMASAILDLLAVPEKALAWGAKGRDLVQAKFTDEAYARQIQLVMNQVLGHVPMEVEQSLGARFSA